jgi:hypothetical protein
MFANIGMAGPRTSLSGSGERNTALGIMFGSRTIIYDGPLKTCARHNEPKEDGRGDG